VYRRTAFWHLPVVTLLLLVIACTPAATPSPTPLIHVVTGTFTLTQDDFVDRTGPGCAGKGGYDDIRNGLDVTIKNESGTILATGSLTSRTPSEITRTCTFTFTVPGVPDDATFYVVEVGKRGELTYSHADMEAANWRVEFTLGS
jgi:hypothetical protein